MKKSFLILSFLLISIQQTNAQVIADEKRHFASLNLSVANPLGNYGGVSSNNNNAGFANTGINFSVEGAFFFKPYIGVGANIGAIANKVNTSAFEEHFSNELKNSGIYGTYSGKVGGWVSTYYMVGPYVSLPLKNLTFDLKILGGLMTTIAPSIDMTINPLGSSNAIHEQSDPAVGSSFGYNLGLGMRYHFNRQWALRVNADYLAANPNISQTLVVSQDGQANRTTNSIHQSIAVFNVGLGLAYQFGR
ncbi:MAG: hypothetical protein JWO58_2346 [Chitinophagaceae bacterium]|nr:hypothetical protein [Chitinophagaceae bacterium]